MIGRCQRLDPGSIPGERILFQLFSEGSAKQRDMEAINSSFYEFRDLNEEFLHKLHARLLDFKVKWNEDSITGKIVLAGEGINGAVSGLVEPVRELQSLLTEEFEFKNIIFKDFPCSTSYMAEDNKVERGFDHKRFIIKFKREIITLKCDVDMKDTAPHMKPETLKGILDSGSDDVVLMDIRNEYEFDMGHFDKSLIVPTKVFSEFSDDEFLENLKKQVEGKKIVTYCTGGVRCEKATALMKKHGFKDVWQLEGGILNYGLKVGTSHWNGKCLVFDRRKAVEISPEAELKQAIQLVCRICDLRIFETEAKCAPVEKCKAGDCEKDLSSLCERCQTRLDGYCSKSCMSAYSESKANLAQ
jgi:UPF0176 protein